MSIEIQNSNLQELLVMYLAKDEIQLGQLIANELTEINLDIERTDYFDTRIALAEGKAYYTKFQCLDKLLDFYSVLEIAFLTNFIPSVNRYDYAEIIIHLNEGNIKNYCFRYFKSLLPLQLLDRLENRSENGVYFKNDSNISLTYNFLSVLDYLEDNKTIFRLFTAKDSSLSKLFNNLFNIHKLTYEKLGKRQKQLVTGYFAYIELLPMIVELIQEANQYEQLKIAITNFFVKFIDDNDGSVKFLLDGTNNLYEKFYDRETTETHVNSFKELRKTINFLRSALSESSSMILV